MGVTFAFLFILAIVVAGALAIFAVSLRNQVSQLSHEIQQTRSLASTAKLQYEEVVGKYNVLTTKYNDDVGRLRQYATAQKEEINRLAKWKNVADAEVKAAQMVRAAQETLTKANAEAEQPYGGRSAKSYRTTCRSGLAGYLSTRGGRQPSQCSTH